MVAILFIDKFTSNFLLSLVYAIHGHMTMYGWNPDGTRMEPRLNSARTGLEPWWNCHGTHMVPSGFHASSIRVPCQFQQGSRPVPAEFHLAFGWWNGNQVKFSSIWGKWGVNYTLIRLQLTCHGQSWISAGNGFSISQCSLHGRIKISFGSEGP